MKRYANPIYSIISHYFALLVQSLNPLLGSVINKLPKFNSLFFFCLFFLATTANGQDSTEVIKRLAQIDWEQETAFANFNQEIVKGKEILSTSKLIQFYEKALNKAQSINNDSLALDYADNLNFYNKKNLNYKASIKYGEIRLKHAQNLKNNREIVASLIYTGIPYAHSQQYLRAIDYYLQAIDFAKANNVPNVLNVIYFNLSACYNVMGQTDEAIVLIKAAIKEEESQNKKRRNRILVDYYIGLATNFGNLEQVDSVEFCINKLIHYLPLLEANDTLRKKDYTGYRYSLSRGYSRVVRFFLETDDLKKGAYYYKIYQKYRNANVIDTYLMDLNYALKTGDLPKAGQLIKGVPEKIKAKDDIRFLHYTSNYYDLIGDYKQSLVFYKKVKEKEIESLKTNRTKYTKLAEMRIENADKEQKLSQLKNEQIIQQNRNQLFIISLVFSLFLLGLLSYLYTQIKKKNSLLQEDLKKQDLIEQQAKKLQLVDKQKTKLFVNIAHELQTPLSIINGLTTQLNKEEIKNEHSKNYLNIIANNGGHLSEQVKQILEFAQLEDYQPTLNPDFFYLNELILQSISELQYRADAKNIQLIFKESTEKPLLKADIDKLKTILKNLMINAIKHSPNESRVVIKLSDNKEAGYEVTIKDFGKGIPSEDIPFLFDRYFQSNTPTSSGGFGIGLAICKEYIELLEGRIEAKSTLDVGSIFRVNIPKNIPNTAIDEVAIRRLSGIKRVAAKAHKLEKSLSETQKRNILIVEDNKDYYTYLESLLQDEFNLSYIPNGVAAIQYLADNRNIDLILTDWMMPQKDGLGLITFLKENQKYQEVPVMMLTARSLVSDQIKAMNYGADDYVLKTLEGAQLLARIKGLVAKQEDKETENDLNKFKFYQVTKNKFLELDEKSQVWLLQLEKTIKSMLENYDLNLPTVAQNMDISLTHLNRKVKKITGLATMGYIQELRYWEARRMLEEKEFSSVKMVCLSVGFKDIKNFSRNFKDRFGHYPSEYLK